MAVVTKGYFLSKQETENNEEAMVLFDHPEVIVFVEEEEIARFEYTGPHSRDKAIEFYAEARGLALMFLEV